MDYARTILSILNSKLGASTEALASELGVSTRTVTNQIAALNNALAGVARIVSVENTWHVEVLDERAYALMREREARENRASLNDPGCRLSALFDLLSVRDFPVTSGELAALMAVSRSTVTSDLGRLREVLDASHLTIVGKPNSGVLLEGTELHKRLAITDHFLERLPYTSRFPDETVLAFVEECEAAGLTTSSTEMLTNWASVQWGRARLGFVIDDASFGLQRVVASRAYEIGRRLTGVVEEALAEELPLAESAFMALPILGMRGPANAREFAHLRQTRVHEPLVSKISQRILLEMGIEVQPVGLRDEFLIHLELMLNRIAFGIQVKRDHASDVASRYPLAHSMAVHAADVIGEELDARISAAELSLLAAYFQVFLHHMQAQRERPLRVAAVHPHGRVEGELLRWQVQEALHDMGEVVAVPESQAGEQALEDFDLAVIREECSLDPGHPPSIRVGAMFDTRELGRKISQLVMRQGQAGSVPGATWMAALTHRENFFLLESATYPAALEEILELLVAAGVTTPETREAMRERESRSTMLMSERLAFPHVATQTDVFAFAVGLFNPRAPSLMVLLAVPDGDGPSSPTLVGLYEEVISLAHSPQELAHIASAPDLPTFKARVATWASRSNPRSIP